MPPRKKKRCAVPSEEPLETLCVYNPGPQAVYLPPLLTRLAPKALVVIPVRDVTDEVRALLTAGRLTLRPSS